MDTVIECLEKRDLIDQISHKELNELVKRPIKLYLGFDPTADSLHIGHLLGIVVLKWFEKYGHDVTCVIGGATGRIGDPSGKSIERPFLDEKILDKNIYSIEKFLKSILPTSNFANNNQWFKEIHFIDFLRDIGKHFRVNTMLTKESVRSRIESDEGISFTEFSYQILQAYDFYYLNKHQDISLQIGGSDQWGNITAGIELGRKLSSQTLYGMTFPLLTRSDGKKFGKTEKGAVWLSDEKLSSYEFYQYLVKIPDDDVIKMLKYLTFLDLDEIYHLEQEMKKPSYEPNTVQRKLAEEVTRFVHGEEGLQAALKATKYMRPGQDADLTVEIIEDIKEDLPHVSLPFSEVIGEKYTDLMVKINMVSSKSEVNRLIANAGAYLNNKKITDNSYKITSDDIIGNKFLLFGKGKKKKALLFCYK